MAIVKSAAGLLKEARRRSGMSQAELGRRAGVTQSVVSAYESGRRQPSLPVLLNLVAASGHALDAQLVAVGAVRRPLSGRLGRRVRRRRQRLKDICATYGASVIGLIGSVARGDEGPDSDIDLLVALSPDTGLFALGRLRRELEELLAADVDIVPAEGLKPGVREAIGHELVVL